LVVQFWWYRFVWWYKLVQNSTIIQIGKEFYNYYLVVKVLQILVVQPVVAVYKTKIK